ncbi:MAG: WYL domain-containing protein [Deltaproteobacteria bacterium]|nr:WYL domain-containing protein [Candidatus Deferrimicrobiaceae bacterium]
MERVLWFDERVRAGSHPGSADLAARFKVSLRTAQRDIEFLRDRLQAPLRYIAAEKGYAYGDPGFYLLQALFRLRGAEGTEPPFASPGKPPDAGRAARRGMRGGDVRNARIRFAPRKAAWVASLSWHPRQRIQLELDGSVVLYLPEARFVEVLGVILQHGGDASVAAPRQLREVIQAEVERLAARYPAKKAGSS